MRHRKTVRQTKRPPWGEDRGRSTTGSGARSRVRHFATRPGTQPVTVPRLVFTGPANTCPTEINAKHSARSPGAARIATRSRSVRVGRLLPRSATARRVSRRRQPPRRRRPACRLGSRTSTDGRYSSHASRTPCAGGARPHTTADSRTRLFYRTGDMFQMARGPRDVQFSPLPGRMPADGVAALVALAVGKMNGLFAQVEG